MLYGIHLICSNEVTILPHIVFWETKSIDGVLGCRRVTFLGKATCLLLKPCGALLLAATFLAAGLPAAWFPTAACLGTFLLSLARGLSGLCCLPGTMPGDGGYITFSDVELSAPSGIPSHQMDLHGRIQQICVFLCTASLEMLLFGDVLVCGTS